MPSSDGQHHRLNSRQRREIRTVREGSKTAAEACLFPEQPAPSKPSGDILSVVAKGFKPAAVLVPIQEIAGEHYLTLIERAATLHSHGGEIAFPGGNVTTEDKDTLAAALREFQEEIGIDPEFVQIIGQLDQVTVSSGYLVTPFVGIV